MPARVTRISTWSSAGSGTSRSTTCSTSGPPHSDIWIARMAGAYVRPSAAHVEAALQRLLLVLEGALLHRLQGDERAHLMHRPPREGGGRERLLERRLLVALLRLVDLEDDRGDLHPPVRRQLLLAPGRHAQGDLLRWLHAGIGSEERQLLVAHRGRSGRLAGRGVGQRLERQGRDV